MIDFIDQTSERMAELNTIEAAVLITVGLTKLTRPIDLDNLEVRDLIVGQAIKAVGAIATGVSSWLGRYRGEDVLTQARLYQDTLIECFIEQAINNVQTFGLKLKEGTLTTRKSSLSFGVAITKPRLPSSLPETRGRPP